MSLSATEIAEAEARRPTPIAEDRPEASNGPYDRVIFGALLVFVAFLSQIAMAQIAYGTTLLTWLARASKERRPVTLPPGLTPFCVFAGLSLVSAFLSVSPAISLPSVRELSLYGIMLVVVNHVDSRQKLQALVDVLLAGGTVLSVWGIAQYLGGENSTEQRIAGPLTHWMTYSGLVVMTGTTAMAYAAYHSCNRRRLVYAAVALAAAVATAFTLTRGAYLALTVAAIALCALRKPVLLLVLVPAALGLFLFLAPGPVRARVSSMYFLDDKTAIDRMYLWRSGLSMIRDHPLFGVGLSMVGSVYDDYRNPAAPKAKNPHLHNNVMQIAAERGLLALAAWLWFFGVLASKIGSRLRSRETRGPAVVAGFLAMIAFQTFGLVEYNSGDSEIEMMLFFLLAIPFAEAALAKDGARLSPLATVGLK